jgi:hypothetical protein
MHAANLASLASTLTGYASALLALSVPVRPHALEQYWLTCRFRHERWSEQLAAHRHAIQHQGVSHRSRSWHEILPVIQEVLLSEPLARCVAYLAQVFDDREIDSSFAPLARNALSIQVEARHRCLHLIVFGQGLSVETAVKLNRLRRTVESYTDELLSSMPPIENLDEFCFDSVAVREAQAKWLQSGPSANQSAMLLANLLSEGLRRALTADVDERVANLRMNVKLSQAVLGLLPETLFDPFGYPKGLRWLTFGKESLESTGQADDLTVPLAYPLSVLLAPVRQTTPSSQPKPRF